MQDIRNRRESQDPRWTPRIGRNIAVYEMLLFPSLPLAVCPASRKEVRS